MDIWRWVSELQDELTESGRPRLAELVERIPGCVVNHEHAQLDAIVPEALALAREAKSPWLELFIRHWNLQSRILHRYEAATFLPEAVRLLELASRDEARECPQSVCVIQDLAGCYAELDGPGYAPERLAVARETLARIDAKWPCFTCISSEYAFGLLDDGDAPGRSRSSTSRPRRWSRPAAARRRATSRARGSKPSCGSRASTRPWPRPSARESETDVNDQLTHALDAARLLARLGRADEALRELPPFERVLPTPSLYERWAQATHALALAGAVPNDWKLEGRLFDLQTRLEGNGVIRIAVHLAHQRAELAFARERPGRRRTRRSPSARCSPGCGRARRRRGSRGAGRHGRRGARLGEVRAPAARERRARAGAAHQRSRGRPRDPRRGAERFADEERLAIIQASAQRALQRNAEAEAGLRAHLAAHPGAHGCLMTLGQALLDQKRSAAARELAEATLRAEPAGDVAVGAHFLLATAYQQEGEREKARPHLDAMLALEPGNTRIELLLASLDREAGRLEESLARLDRLVEREPRPGNHDWDRMVTATLLERWDAVRASAIRIGMNLKGEGPIEEAWGLCRIELREPDGEIGIHHALRTGPVTARILDVARPRAPQHYGDEIVFEASPRNAAPKPGEADHSYLYPALATRKPGGYEAFLLDGVHPGEGDLTALRAELTALGCVLAVQSDATYVVTEAATGEAHRGLFAYLAAPATCSRRALHDLLTQRAGSPRSRWCGPASRRLSSSRTSSPARPRSSSASACESASVIPGPRSPPRSSSPQHQQPRLRHLFHRVPRPLAPEPAVAHAAVGHQIDAERRRVVVDERADLDPLPRVEHRADVVGEDPALEAEARGRGELDGVLHRVGDLEGDHRAEDLLGHDLRRRGRALDQRRRDDGSATIAADEHLASEAAGLLDPRGHTLGVALVDQRSAHGDVLGRIAEGDGPRAIGEGVAEPRIHLLVDDDPLHRDARLPGLVEAADSAARGGAIDVGVGQDDRRRVAAELEHHALLARVALHAKPDVGAPGEREQAQPLVLHQALAGAPIAGHDADPAARHACPPSRSRRAGSPRAAWPRRA